MPPPRIRATPEHRAEEITKPAQAADVERVLGGPVKYVFPSDYRTAVAALNKGEPLPVDLRGRFIYYVGPVDPVRDEVVGPAGPTTSTRMDKFTDTMLGKTGLIAMVGKAERGPAAIESIRNADFPVTQAEENNPNVPATGACIDRNA